MSQYESRMHIMVSSPKEWEKLYHLDLHRYEVYEKAEEAFDLQGTEWVISEWSCTEKKLKEFVTQIAEALGEEGIVFADTTNINEDPYAYIVYSAGYGVCAKRYGYDEFCFETDIYNLTEYLSYGKHFSFGELEIENLRRFGIERVKEGNKFSFRKILRNEGLNDDIVLTDTRFEGRTERIERVNCGDLLSLVHRKEENNPNCVDVLWNGESIGLLEADAADIMAPIIDAGEKEYMVTVSEVVPLSKRSKRCQTALVSVHIQF